MGYVPSPEQSEGLTFNCKITMKAKISADVPKNSKGIWNRFMEGISIAIIIVVMVALKIALAYLFNRGFEPAEYYSWM